MTEFPSVLCCECGIPIRSNPSNTCASCLASRCDISRGITTETTLHQCRGCQRWHVDSGKWMACELESRELMSICLNKIPGLKAKSSQKEKFRVVDSSWIWTEPHSMRLKVRLKVQREVELGTILQQSMTVTFIVRNEQCIECQSEFRQGSWKVLVQVRQRVKHKRTFLYLEQLILKHDAHRGCLSIETCRDGMDFYFPDKSKSSRFMSFLEGVTPIRSKSSKKLISMDDKCNVANYKYTFLIEICPLCKDDMLYLPKSLARKIGNISRLVLVKNITCWIHVIDPISGQTASFDADQYWRDAFQPLVVAARSRFTKYIILGKEPIFLQRNQSKRQPSHKAKSRLASITISKEADLGYNDQQYEVISHIGYLLKAGDVCVGYDLQQIQFSDFVDVLPDAIILRKLYGSTATTSNSSKYQRNWKMERLQVEVTEDSKTVEVDEEDFMREIETDKDMRCLINVYKSKLTLNSDSETDDDDDQRVSLNELLDGLQLDTGPDSKEQEMPNNYVEGEKAQQDGISYFTQEEARTLPAKSAATLVQEK